MAAGTSNSKRVIYYRRPPLYPEQAEAIFGPHRGAVIEASTKAGKTVGCIAWLTEQAALKGGPGRVFRWVAPTYGVARIAFRRTLRGIPPQFYTANLSNQEITLCNGSIIQFMGSDKPDNIYGEDVWACVVDEASRCKEESWAAVRSTLTATRGPIRLIGNVKGRGNFAYKLARKAQAESLDGWRYFKITADDAIRSGVLTQAEIDAARAELPEDVFLELYYCVPADDGANPFGLQHIAACKVDALSRSRPWVWGWDLAKSTDWTVGVALDEGRRVCRFVRFRKPWPETIATIRQLTGETPALIDSTGVGDPILEALQRPAASPWVPPIIGDSGHIDWGNNAGRHGVDSPEEAQAKAHLLSRGNFEGYTFTSKSKQMLMEGLAVAIQSHALRLPEATNPRGVLLQELETFEYEYTRRGARYSAPEGMHDDCVCALALASFRYDNRPADAFAI